MERRKFFSRLAAGIAGVAIAPRVAAELAKTDEINEINEYTTPAFDTDALDNRIEELKDRSSYNDQCFFGKKIRWNNKGEIRCMVDEGVMPRVNDIILLNLLDDHHLPIMAVVTTVSLQLVRMITMDSEDPDRMVDLASIHLEQNTCYSWPGGWLMNLEHNDAFMGIPMYSASAEKCYSIERDFDGKILREGYMNIDWDQVKE